MFKNAFETIKKNFSFHWIAYFFLAFVAFNFTNNLIVFVSISLVGNIIFFIFEKKKYNEVNLLTLLLCLIPMLGFLVFAVGSTFNEDPNANISVVDYIFIFIACLSIPFLGFQARTSKKFDIKQALKVIYIALATYMFINVIITLVHFGPFYTFIYNDRYFFDYGHLDRLPINKIAYMLLGFKSAAVTAEYFTLFASLLSSAILGAFFVSYKEDKGSFLVYLICGSIGLLCILLTLNKGLLVSYAALLFGFVCAILFGKKIIKYNKTTKIVAFSIIGLAGLVFVIFMLSALNVQPLAGLIEGNTLLNKLFNTNRVIRKYHNIVRTMVDCGAYRGFTGYLAGRDTVTMSGSWLFDMFAIGQIFGWITFIIFVVIVFYRYYEYCKVTNNDLVSKILVIGILLALFLFTIAGYDSMPYFENTNYVPLFLVTPFTIVLFMFGYTGENEEEIVL